MISRRTLLSVAGLTLSTGCAKIPTQGPIEEVSSSAKPPGIDIAPGPPEAQADPSRVLEGFLLAMTSPDGNYAVARQYLTSEAAKQWDPQDTVIYSGSVSATGAAAQLTGRKLGRLSKLGHYRCELTELDLVFSFAQVSGEWRISSAPNYLLLSRYLFERYFSPVHIYFLDPSGKFVVPEIVHLPEPELTPQNLINLVLAGPSEDIAKAVTTALPAEAQVSSHGTSIGPGGVVTVDLTGVPFQLDEDTRRGIGAQLLWTLTAITRVTGVLITVDGKPLTIPGTNELGVFELAAQQGYQVLSRATTADLFGVQGQQAGRWNGAGTFSPWALPNGSVAETAVSLDGALNAVIETGRTTVLIGTHPEAFHRLGASYKNLRSAQLVQGLLWLLGDDASGTTHLLTINPNGKVSRVAITIPQASQIVDFAISPTGARAALIVATAGRHRLGIALTDAAAGRQVAPWRELVLEARSQGALTHFYDVAWRSETSLAMVAAIGELTTTFIVNSDGTNIEDLGFIGSKPFEITAAPRVGGGPIAVRSQAGIAWRYEARTRWARLADNATMITFAR